MERVGRARLTMLMGQAIGLFIGLLVMAAARISTLLAIGVLLFGAVAAVIALLMVLVWQQRRMPPMDDQGLEGVTPVESDQEP